MPSTYWPYDPTPYDDLFKSTGQQYGVDPGLLRTVAGMESNFNPRAISPRGARGMMQFMEPTGRDYGLFSEEDFFDPAKSVDAAGRYYKTLLDRYKGDQSLALAAYNAGMGNVDKYGGVPPFPETEKYVQKFDKRYRDTDPERVLRNALSMDSKGPPSPTSAQTPEEILRRSLGLAGPQKSSSDSSGGLSFDISEMNPYPKGSKEWSEYIRRHGGVPAILPSSVHGGSAVPGSTFPDAGPFESSGQEFYPTQFKGRVDRIIDADTISIQEMGTGQTRTVRLPSVQAPELGTVPGDEGRDYLRSQLAPGTQITLASPERDTGVHGRSVAKAFYQDDQGRWVDMERPWEVTDERHPLGGDPFLDTSEEQEIGHLKAAASALLLEPVELAQIPQDLAAWINDDYTPEQNSRVYKYFDSLERRMKEAQAEYVSQGYDPDAMTFNIPVFGKVTASELMRGAATSGSYALGLTWILGKATKTLRAGMYGVDMARGMDRAAVSTLNQSNKYHKALLKRHAKEAAEKGHQEAEWILDLAKENRRIHGEIDTMVHTLAPQGNATAIDRLRMFKDGFISNWQDRFNPIIKYASRVGKEADARHWTNVLRASGDVANSPISHGVTHWVTDSAGKWRPKQVYKSLEEIWQRTSSQIMREAGAYMAVDRLVNDLYPEFRTAVKLAGGDEAKAISAAKKANQRLIPVSTEEFTRAKTLMTDIENNWGAMGPENTAGIMQRIQETREWSIKSTLDQLMEVGMLSQKSYDNILAKNGHYAPFHRLTTDVIEQALGKEAVMDILRMEDELLEGSGVAAILGRGLSEGGVSRTPVGRLKKGLGTDPEKMIVDPMQTMMIRVPAIQKVVNQQRVRNMLGETIDELAEGGDDWVRRTIYKSEAPRHVEAVTKGGVENGFVRFIKNSDGTTKKVAYMTQDPALAEAIRAMSPSHMSLFKRMVQHPLTGKLMAPTRLFRSGTILGLHFMVRNPFRDQFMASVMTKYGYTPVVDWWRGLYHVLSESDLYKSLHRGGATQSTFTAANADAVEQAVTEITTGARFSDLRRIFKDPDFAPLGEAPAQTALGRLRQQGGPSELVKNSARHFFAKSVKPGSSQPSTHMQIAHAALQRVSEVFEEATRTGAAARAVSRAKRGKKYTIARSLDEAAGGAAGWFGMLTKPTRAKGFLGRYKKARTVDPADLADSPLDADIIDEVRNITLDFQRRGDYGEILNGFYPFFNAELQDYGRFSRAFREAPLTTMMRGMAFVSVPAMANWYMNYDSPEYQQQEDVEKELFMHPFGYDERYKKFGRVSRPIGMVSGFFGLLPHKTLDYLARNEPEMIRVLEEELWPGKSAKRSRDAFMETMHGIDQQIPDTLKPMMFAAAMGNYPMTGVPDPAGQPRMDIGGDPMIAGQPPGEYAGEQAAEYLRSNTLAQYVMPGRQDFAGFLAAAAPQFASPIAEVATGYDPFFDTAVGGVEFQNNPLLPEDETRESTTAIEKALGAGLNQVLPWDVNPLEAAHLVRGYTGSLGATVMMAADGLGKGVGLFDEPLGGVPKNITDMPVPKAFFSRSPWGNQSKPVTEMYEAWERDQRVLNSLKRSLEDVKVDRFQTILRDHPEWVAAEILNQGMDDLSFLQETRRELRFAPELTDEERADALFQIDTAMTQYAYEIMRVYNNLRRNPEIVEMLRQMGTE